MLARILSRIGDAFASYTPSAETVVILFLCLACVVALAYVNRPKRPSSCGLAVCNDLNKFNAVLQQYALDFDPDAATSDTLRRKGLEESQLLPLIEFVSQD